MDIAQTIIEATNAVFAATGDKPKLGFDQHNRQHQVLYNPSFPSTNGQLTHQSLKALEGLYQSLSPMLDEDVRAVFEQVLAVLESDLDDDYGTSLQAFPYSPLKPCRRRSKRLSFLSRLRHSPATKTRHAHELGAHTSLSYDLRSREHVLEQILSTARSLYKIQYCALSSQEPTSAPSNPSLPPPPHKADTFEPSFSSLPALVPDAVLHFDDPSTMEAKLKQAVLRSVASPHGASSVTAAIGASGMGGVGKTTALLGLATQRDIRASFSDGIYFISIGQDASATSLIRQLSNIVLFSGGRYRAADKIQSARDLGKALNLTVEWFRNRRVLFILDDMWASIHDELGFLPPLRGLLDASTHCRLAVSTRSQVIADAAGAFVSFAPRDVQGRESRTIFLQYANVSAEEYNGASIEDRKNVANILDLCGGIPLTLGVAGRAIRSLSRDMLGGWTAAVHAYYLKQLAAPSVSDRELGEYPNFRRTVLVSLKLMDDWWDATFKRAGKSSREDRPRGGNDVFEKQSCSILFARLCVLPRQGRVRVSLLAKIWHSVPRDVAVRLADKLTDLNLLSPVQQSGESRFSMHDLLLDVCKSRIEDDASFDANQRFIQTCHRQLLDQFRRRVACKEHHPVMNGEAQTCHDVVCDDADQFWNVSSVEMATFSWWDAVNVAVEDDSDGDYLTANVSRHLVKGKLRAELVATLTRAEWTACRLKFGGLSAMISDFDVLLSSTPNPADRIGKAMACNEKEATHPISMGPNCSTFSETCKFTEPFARKQTERDLSALRDAIRLLWAYCPDRTHLATQAYARLQDVPLSGALVQRYLKSARDLAPVPWIRPLRRCYPLPLASAEYVVPLPTSMWYCEVNWAKETAAIAGGSSVVWYDTKRRHASKTETEIKDRSNGEGVTTLALAPSATFAVSGSDWGDVHVWDKKTIVKTLRGPDTRVWAVAVSPDGIHCVSGHAGGAVHLWNIETGECIAKRGSADVENHEGQELPECHVDNKSFVQVRTLQYSPDGESVLVGSRDRKLHLLNAQTLQDISEDNTFVGHTNCVLSAAFRHDGLQIATSADDNTLRVWDVSSRKQLAQTLEYARCIAFGVGGRLVVTGGSDKCVRVWDASTLKLVCGPFRGHAEDVLNVMPHPDGVHVLSAAGGDNTLRMWNMEAGQREMRDRASGHEVIQMRGHDQRVFYTACRSDGAFVAAACGDGAVRFWDVGKCSRAPDMEMQASEWQPLRRVAYSPDHSLVGFSTEYGGSVGVLDMRKNERIVYLPDLHRDMVKDAVVNALEFSTDGRWLASGSTGAVFIVNARTGELGGLGSDGPLRRQGGDIRCMRFFGQQLVSGSTDGTLCVWFDDGSSLLLDGKGKEGEKAAVHCMELSKDSRLLFVGFSDGELYIWDMVLFTCVAGPFKLHDSSLRCVSLSADEELLATVGYDSVLAVHRWKRMERVHQLCCIGKVTLPSYAESVGFLRRHEKSVHYQVLLGANDGVGHRFNIDF